jgi:O-antigen/teichoic acid export membrane protein
MTHEEAVTNVLEHLGEQRLSASAVVSTGRWVVSLALMAVVFPVMLYRLGAAGVGFWAVLTLPTSMAAVFDLGLIPGVVAFVGPAVGRARDGGLGPEERWESLKAVRRIAFSGLLLALLLATGIGVVGFITAPMLVRVIVSSADPAAVFLFRASIFNLSATVLGEGLIAPLEGTGRVDVSALTAGLLSVLNSVGLLVAMLLSPGFTSIAVVVLVSGCLTVVVPLLAWEATGLRTGLGLIDGSGLSVKPLVRLGIGLGGAGSLGALVDPVVKSLGLAFAGPVAVAAYELAMRLMTMLGGLFRSALYPLMSHYARRQGGDGSTVSADVAMATRSVAVVGLPTVAAVAGAAPSLAWLWLGPRSPAGFVACLIVLAVGNGASLLAVPMYLALLSAGRSRQVFFIQLSTIVSAVAVACVAGLTYPRLAAPLGMAVGISVGALATSIFMSRLSGSAQVGGGGATGRGVIGALGIAAIAAVLGLLNVTSLTSIAALFVAWAAVVFIIGRREVAGAWTALSGMTTSRPA